MGTRRPRPRVTALALAAVAAVLASLLAPVASASAADAPPAATTSTAPPTATTAPTAGTHGTDTSAAHTDGDHHEPWSADEPSPSSPEERAAAEDHLRRAGTLGPGETVLHVDDHRVVIAAPPSEDVPTIADTGPAGNAPQAEADEHAPAAPYALTFGTGLLSTYITRPLVGTPASVVNDTRAAADRAGQITGVRFVDGPAIGSRNPGFGEMTIEVSGDNPCGLPPTALGGCALAWWDGTKITKSAVIVLPAAVGHRIGPCVAAHEVGHALGLAHVDDRSQLMFPTATLSSPCTYQAGDTAGLQAMARTLHHWGPPFGAFESVTSTADRQATATGWAIDPNTLTAPIQVEVRVDGGAPVQATADVRRPDVAAAHPSAGERHGFSVVLNGLAPGSRQVCVTALNVSTGVDTPLGCKNVTISSLTPAAPLVPTLEAVSATSLRVRWLPGSGGGAATTYTATVTNATTGATRSCTATNPTVGCEVGDLPAGRYTARVVAANAHGSSSPSPASTPMAPAEAATFTPLPPTRILDSRSGVGVQRHRTPWGTGTTRDVTVVGSFGPGAVVPINASAVVVNLTATDTTDASYATAWPAGQDRPNVSNLNWPAGDTRANLVTVPVGVDGKIRLYHHYGSAHLVADVVGYWSPAGATTFTATPTPVRILDSRDGTGVERHRSPWRMSESRPVTVRGTFGATTVPAGATAAVLNLTATDTTLPSFATVYPSGQALPLASNLNWPTGDTRANLVTVPIGADGKVRIHNHVGAAHMVADLVGYYVPSDAGAALRPISPTRVLDSRAEYRVGAYSSPWQTGTCRNFTVTGRVGEGGAPAWVPTDAESVVVNLTAVDPAGASFATLFAAGAPTPLASNLNWPAGDTRANLAVVKVGDGGQVRLCNLFAATHFVVDVVGYTTSARAT